MYWFLIPILALFLSSSLVMLHQLISFLKERRRRKDALSDAVRHLPELMDNMSLLLMSGSTLSNSLQSIVTTGRPGILTRSLNIVTQKIRTGVSTSRAFEELAEEIPVKEVKSFTRLIIRSEIYGLKLAEMLEQLATQIRYQRSMNAEKLAQQLPVKLLLPLAIFIFPATVMPFVAVVYARLVQ